MGVDLSGVLPELLADRGWTQQDLADRTGMTRNDINAIANGRIAVGRVRHQRIAEAFGLTVADVPGEAVGQPRGTSLNDRLARLEEAVDRLGEEMTEGLRDLAREVQGLSRKRSRGGRPAKKTAAR